MALKSFRAEADMGFRIRPRAQLTAAFLSLIARI
jgi:hypothetical protein